MKTADKNLIVTALRYAASMAPLSENNAEGMRVLADSLVSPKKAVERVEKPRCGRCGSRRGHHSGCDRNYWKMPSVSTPKRGTAAWDKLHGKVMAQIADLSNPRSKTYIRENARASWYPRGENATDCAYAEAVA